MIDSCAIFTRGGLLLWRHDDSDIEGHPIDHLIQEVLLEERQGVGQYKYGDYQLKWCFANDYDLVFVAAYLPIGRVAGVDDLLSAVRTEFCASYQDELAQRTYRPEYSDFTDSYTFIVEKFERTRGKGKAQGAPLPNTSKSTKSPVSGNTGPEDEFSSSLDDVDDNTNSPTDDDPASREMARLARIEELKRRAAQAKLKPKAVASPAAAPASGKKSKTKAGTKWEDSKLSKEEAAALDFSADKDDEAAKEARLDRDAEITARANGGVPSGNYWDEKEEDESAAAAAAAAEGKGVWGYLKGLVGQKELTAEDLAGVKKQFVDLLVQKNVASDIADKLVDSVVQGLVGKRLGTLQTMYQTVRKGLEEALARILTPKRPVDVLTGVASAREQGRPYSIVFCGVNGVGKSTSLSKIAAFFLAQGLKVGVAACDTFRSGAIEQLKTHCRALNIPLYDKGYGRDEATVAADGILNAKKDGLDVILIDTAGRMQGNESLMKGLAKLMNTNNPDLILFVGEALVGNDGCDQLINFNRALANNSGKQHPRLIDGIVLTKFDTIDDKVGAAISMTYSTGQPIVFVGTGQTYRDLKRPNPKMLINALLK